jgi:hypothetical protein
MNIGKALRVENTKTNLPIAFFYEPISVLLSLLLFYLLVSVKDLNVMKTTLKVCISTLFVSVDLQRKFHKNMYLCTVLLPNFSIDFTNYCNKNET